MSSSDNSPKSSPAASPLAVFFMILSSLSFALMGVVVKDADQLPVFQKVFFRNIIMLFIIAVPLLKSGLSSGKGFRIFLGNSGTRKFLLLRSFLGLAGVILYFYTVDNMNLADSSLLNRLSPFFVTLFAVIFLKNKLFRYQIPALVLAFTGALFIIKPRFDLSILPALAGLTAAATAGGAYSIINYLKGKESPDTLIFWFSGFSTLATLPLALAAWKAPDAREWAALLATGVFASGGQYFVTRAYQRAPAGEISIYNYTHILFSGILGWMVFNEIPDPWSVLGGVIILAVAWFSFQRSRRVQRR